MAFSLNIKNLYKIDFWLLISTFLLLNLGLILVYSSSSTYGAHLFNDSEYFIKRQILSVCLGIFALFFLSSISREILIKYTGIFMLISTFLCILVLIPKIGIIHGGARRWLSLGFITFQPSELSKLAIIILLAKILSQNEKDGINKQINFILPVFIVQIPVLLILSEPDLGTALIIESILCIMLFIAGMNLRILFGFALLLLPFFYHYIIATPFRLKRVLSYIDPWAYRQTSGYQITESLISIGSGGIFGLGLGESKHSLFFLPEAHTDFIFSILGEELGLIGISIFLILFSIFLWRIALIILNTKNCFDRYLGVGLMALIGIPLVFNTLVATGLLPTKGLPLPLISYGGSNLLITLIAIGMLLRIYMNNQITSIKKEKTP